LEDVEVDEGMILRWIFKKMNDRVWIDPAQERGNCRALVNCVLSPGAL